jgi:hypothetical protein
VAEAGATVGAAVADSNKHTTWHLYYRRDWHIGHIEPPIDFHSNFDRESVNVCREDAASGTILDHG